MNQPVSGRRGDIELEHERSHPALATATPPTRQAVAHTLLDFLRRELCVKVDYLDRDFQEKLVARSGQHLVGVWALDDEERLEYASVVYPRSRRRGDDRGLTYLSGRSGYGQYLRRISTFPDRGGKLSVAESETIIADLLLALSKGVWWRRSRRHPTGPRGTRSRPPRCGGWRATAALRPRTRFACPGVGHGADPQRVLRRLLPPSRPRHGRYRSAGAHRPGRLRSPGSRERRFREATLPVLFCSPTMELGVDISELNAVNLRNVPPTPANYAQRSGRAGRSGRPALVFTHCAAGSPHDQYFFRRPHLMVSGQVTPPRRIYLATDGDVIEDAGLDASHGIPRLTSPTMQELAARVAARRLDGMLHDRDGNVRHAGELAAESDLPSLHKMLSQLDRGLSSIPADPSKALESALAARRHLSSSLEGRTQEAQQRRRSREG